MLTQTPVTCHFYGAHPPGAERVPMLTQTMDVVCHLLHRCAQMQLKLHRSKLRIKRLKRQVERRDMEIQALCKRNARIYAAYQKAKGANDSKGDTQ